MKASEVDGKYPAGRNRYSSEMEIQDRTMECFDVALLVSSDVTLHICTSQDASSGKGERSDVKLEQ